MSQIGYESKISENKNGNFAIFYKKDDFELLDNKVESFYND